MQLVSSAAQTDAVVCSTLMEAWQIAKSDLMKEGIVKDVSHSNPCIQRASS